MQQIFRRRNHQQTNGKIERLNGLVKQEAIRPNSPQSYKEAGIFLIITFINVIIKDCMQESIF